MVHVAVLHLELFLPGCHSLKEKRSVTQRLLTRLRNQHNASISEVEHQDLWQRAYLAIAAASANRGVLEQLFQRILKDVDGLSEEFEVSGQYLEWR